MHEKDLLKTELEIQEQTFQNISREIHDNIGQKLSLAKLHLNTLNFEQVKVSEQKVTESVDIISQAISDLSDISRSMSTELILGNGLIRALEFETEQLQRSGQYQLELTVNGESSFLQPKTELLVFRIVQESINNIIKHSCAKKIEILLEFEDDILILKIEDNGKGFTDDRLINSNGLINMRKRAELLSGICEVSSQPGKGTIVNIKIPLNEHN